MSKHKLKLSNKLEKMITRANELRESKSVMQAFVNVAREKGVEVATVRRCGLAISDLDRLLKQLQHSIKAIESDFRRLGYKIPARCGELEDYEHKVTIRKQK